MKKIISILLILCFALSLLSSCNAAGESETDATDIKSTNGATEGLTSKPTERPKQTTGSNKKPKPDTEENEDGTLKILTIGNSFSDDTMQYVYQIAESAGVEKIKLGNLYIGGCSLDLHATNARENRAAYDYRVNSGGGWFNVPEYRMYDAIVSENWDFISLQQASGSSGIGDTYSNLQYMIDYVRSLAPNAKIVWNMTWAYQQDSTHGEFYKYGSDQMQMYQSIVSTVKNKVCSNSAFTHVIPNGTAIQNARTSYVGDRLTRDGFHLSLDLGRFIAGLTFFYGLTGISVENIDYMPEGIDGDLFKIAIESAMNAVESPWEVTESEYKSAPEFDADAYDVLDLGLTMLGYWNSSVGRGIDTVTANHISFAASRLFTREDIPVGSIITVAEGWKYRPDAWKSEGAQSGPRPDNVTSQKVVVTERWWGEYTHRGFNISKIDGSSLEGISVEDIEKAFVIYVPKS